MSDFRNIIKKELGHLFQQDELEEEEGQKRTEIVPPRLTHFNQELTSQAFEKVEIPLLKVENKLQAPNTEKSIQK
jgi:hypothetical protein